MCGGEWRIRTSVGIRRQIYSLLPLSTRATPRTNQRGWREESNLRLADHESVFSVPSLPQPATNYFCRNPCPETLSAGHSMLAQAIEWRSHRPDPGAEHAGKDRRFKRPEVRWGSSRKSQQGAKDSLRRSGAQVTAVRRERPFRPPRQRAPLPAAPRCRPCSRALPDDPAK